MIKRWLLTRPVPRPKGVRIERADGSVVPVELVYNGVVDGLHEWAVLDVVLADGDTVCADVLPARTTIAIQAGRP